MEKREAGRLKSGRPRRKPRKRRGDGEDADEEYSKPGIALHWYIFSFSILLVTGLSFLNFMALPDVQAHSLLSAVLIRRKAAVSTDPHSYAGLDGLNERERLALLKAAEEALEAPMPVLQGAGGSSSGALRDLPDGESHARDPFQPMPRPPAPSGMANALRGRAQAAANAAVQSSAQAGPLHVATGNTATAGRGGVATFSGDSWLTLPEPGDHDELTFGAWIYLPDVPASVFPPSSESMKTIASTKVSGCDTKNAGWAFFVHEWSTTNRQLRLSWTDSVSGCNEVYSDTSLVPYDQWVLVGFSLSKVQNRASIVMGKSLVVDTNLGIGKYVRQGVKVDVTQAQVRNRKTNDAAIMQIGAHAKNERLDYAQAHIFIGFMGDVRLLSFTVDTMKLVALLESKVEDLIAGQAGAPASAVKAVIQFQEGAVPTNLLSGLRLNAEQTSFAQGHAVVQMVKFVDSDVKMVHPILKAVEPVPEVSVSPQPTLDPTALKATWPQEWLERFTENELQTSQEEANPWADEVRAAMMHSWNGYRARAWGRDDIQTVRGAGKDWCKMAVTMLDALSTLWVMGLKDEFNAAAEWLVQNPQPSPGQHGKHSLFEINIRAFGGLLSAYSLSGQDVFLDTAKRLGEKLLMAFKTSHGIPLSTVDIGTGDAGKHSWMPNIVLAEATTLQVEFRYMTHVTGDDRYAKAADKAMNAVLAAVGTKGLVPIYFSVSSGAPAFVGTKMSLGAMGDSYYEYLLKQWIQNGKKDDYLKDHWKRAMNEMMDKMVAKTASGLQFLAELEGGRQRHRMDHLACFVAGMLMLGSRTLPKDEVDSRWEPFAAELTRTCCEMYTRTPTGLSPEYMVFNIGATNGDDMKIPNDAPHNLLRPEAAEAVWYMWYYTGDDKYRKMGQKMWSPFMKYAKARWGFSAVSDVRKKPPPLKDSQESFWLAETLKYFYLIFSPRNTVNLEEFVLNTEAQPLRMWDR